MAGNPIPRPVVYRNGGRVFVELPHRYAEELMGQEGFSSNSSLLYHRNSPSALTAIEAVDPAGSDEPKDQMRASRSSLGSAGALATPGEHG